MTRAERSQVNRAAILASAREHFEQFGYHGASVDTIAEAAGFSKGAIYSQFGSKDDLMLAVLEQAITQRHAATERMIATLGDTLHIEDVIDEAFSKSLGEPAWQAALTEFRIHASRQPALNDRYRTLHEQTVNKIASVMALLIDRFEIDTRFSPHQLAVSYFAAGLGLIIETFTVDHLDPVEYVQSLATLARRIPYPSKGDDR